MNMLRNDADVSDRQNKIVNTLKKAVIILIAVTLAMLSISKLTPVTVDPDAHKHSVQRIDDEIESVLKLTAGAAGASAVISLLPGDQCTPIAEQFAELGKYFLIVLSALYLEKYLVTMMGYVSFAVILPLALMLLGCGIAAGRDKMRAFSYKLLITAVALYLMIPLSVKASEVIYLNYETSIEATLDTVNEISIDNNVDEGVVDRFLAWIENAAVSIVDYLTGLLSDFIDAVAVMLVTSCLIPILVILAFTWIFKVLYRTDLTEPLKIGIKTE
ncbi:MAG: hypothetical protein K5868_06300 [Lachnospiraceae bacterium]|nr:hypothetical protein [Lachnospiraceae bacterium]